jgi:hypothetical protein
MRSIQFGLVIAAAMFLIATAVKSQAPAQPGQVWEYSSVSAMPFLNSGTSTGINSITYRGSARICYATAQGCHVEELTKTGESDGVGEEALMMAASRLGADGWELTAATDVDTNRLERTLYFRRLKRDSK